MGILLVASVSMLACNLTSLPSEPIETGMPAVVVAPTGQLGYVKTDYLPLSQVLTPSLLTYDCVHCHLHLGVFAVSL
jgi:hypothetical protein